MDNGNNSQYVKHIIKRYNHKYDNNNFSFVNENSYEKYLTSEELKILKTEDVIIEIKEDKDKIKKDKTIIPLSNGKKHYSFVLKAGENNFFIDSSGLDLEKEKYNLNIKDETKENICVLPKLYNNDNHKFICFQSSNVDCWLIGSKVAKILSFVPNNILNQCIKNEKILDSDELYKKILEIINTSSYILSPVPQEILNECKKDERTLDFNKLYYKIPQILPYIQPSVINDILNECKKDKKILDFKKLNEVMPNILPHILSFCQSQTYVKTFCALHKIEYDELLKQEFIKNKSNSGLNKIKHFLFPPRKTNLIKLLNKCSELDPKTGKTHNKRPDKHRKKIENTVNSQQALSRVCGILKM